MEVLNIHERELEAELAQVGVLLDSLASEEDRLWPKHTWPRMELDRSLGVGARGGHGPVRYWVEEYTVSQSVKFRFTSPRGFDGFHGYTVLRGPEQTAVLRHTLKMNTNGLAILLWPLLYRPLHDALIEESLDVAEVSLGLPPRKEAWSLWVKALRWLVSTGRARSQAAPNEGSNSAASERREG